MEMGEGMEHLTPATEVAWVAHATNKKTRPLRDWRMAMSRFIIEFGDRLDGHF
ncbi:hypothetical protein K5J60_004803 [Salmonella enterica]|nr:hypothetical protein [Salmonella enterica subsp. enterica serovar Enteritidis]EFO9811968.1 hypothetical protein [Salmonella enterica subsp. enterica serovar Enteritidis]EHZ1642715.1 hypothetical protein [Salmonella enterica]EIZ5737339.1 hypothetical protein [Salmonella enterica]